MVALLVATSFVEESFTTEEASTAIGEPFVIVVSFITVVIIYFAIVVPATTTSFIVGPSFKSFKADSSVRASFRAS